MDLRSAAPETKPPSAERRRLALLALALSCLAPACSDAGDDDSLSSGAAGNSFGAGGSGATSEGTDDELAQAMLDAHNSVRRGLDEPQPELSWSEDLAAYAVEWAEQLARRCGSIQHRDQRQYGENIALRGSSRLTQPFSPEEAVQGWAAEAACWGFGTIRGSESCESSCVAALNSNGCGHYTQLIWGDTERVGCGYATCESNYQFEIWVCNYDPPGNFIGRAPY